jgi:hypothetical protein
MNTFGEKVTVFPLPASRSWEAAWQSAGKSSTVEETSRRA